MGIGTSLFLIAVGAILYFAVDADISGLEISTIGLILMVVGVIGLVISLFFSPVRRRAARWSATAPVVRDREPLRGEPLMRAACPFGQAALTGPARWGRVGRAPPGGPR